MIDSRERVHVPLGTTPVPAGNTPPSLVRALPRAVLPLSVYMIAGLVAVACLITANPVLSVGSVMVLLVLRRASDVWWFCPLHFTLDMTQFHAILPAA